MTLRKRALTRRSAAIVRTLAILAVFGAALVDGYKW